VQNGQVTAFFCADDDSAALLMKFLSARGLPIPGKVAVIGFNGMPFCPYLTPTLTTVLQPLAELAEKTMTRLLAAEPPPDEALLIKPKLVLGESCGCRPAVDSLPGGTKWSATWETVGAQFNPPIMK
jgi:LacI family transcriptional regulator